MGSSTTWALAPEASRRRLLPFVGRSILLAAIPLALVWIPVGRVPGAGNVSASDAALMLLWLACAVELLLCPSPDVDLRAVLLVALSLGIAALAGIASAGARADGKWLFDFMLVMKRFGLASVLPLAACLFRSRRMPAWVRGVTAAGIATLLVFNFFPSLQDHLPKPDVYSPTLTNDRSIGSLTNPNDMAYAAITLAILHAAFLPRRARLADRALLAATAAGAAICVILSGSRSGALGGAAAIVFISLSSSIRLRSKAALVAATAILAIAGMTYSTVFEHRIGRAYREGLEEENVSSRLDAQLLAARMSLSHPLGVGFTGFEAASARERTNVELTTTDSIYFDTLLGAGYLGLAALLWLFAAAWRHVATSGPPGHPRGRLLAAGILAFLVFGTATIVPMSVFLSPLFFYLPAAASLGHGDAG